MQVMALKNGKLELWGKGFARELVWYYGVETLIEVEKTGSQTLKHTAVGSGKLNICLEDERMKSREFPLLLLLKSKNPRAS